MATRVDLLIDAWHGDDKEPGITSAPQVRRCNKYGGE